MQGVPAELIQQAMFFGIDMVWLIRRTGSRNSDVLANWEPIVQSQADCRYRTAQVISTERSLCG